MDEKSRLALLAELNKWRDDGDVSEAQHAALTLRYATPFADAEDGSEATNADSPGVAASSWFQLVGGLLLGAGLVAFVLFLDLQRTQASLAMLGLGAIATAAGYAMGTAAPDRRGLADALLAAGLVAVGVACPLTVEDYPWGPVLGAAMGAGVFAWRRGASPVVVAATAVFVSGTFSFATSSTFSGTYDAAGNYIRGAALAGAFIAWGSLLAFGAFMLIWRREAWTNVALAPFVAALSFAFFMVLDELDVGSSEAYELWMGAQLALLLVLGIYLGARGLAVGAAAGLTIDAVVFAFDVGGALTAVVLLVTLGGLLVWQAELLRAYFRGHRGPRKPKEPSARREPPGA